MTSRVLRGAVGLLLACALTACSGGSEGDATPTQVVEPSVAPAWNPCSGLDAAEVSQLFDVEFGTRLGTADSPLCTFTSATEGDPAIDINYQQIVGNLRNLLTTFGSADGSRTTVVTPKVPGASGSRMIIDTSGDTVAITAFVRVDRLVQVVNVLDPQPYQRAELVGHVETLLADLAANASTSGLTN